jgi:hypothetical protein
MLILHGMNNWLTGGSWNFALVYYIICYDSTVLYFIVFYVVYNPLYCILRSIQSTVLYST